MDGATLRGQIGADNGKVSGEVTSHSSIHNCYDTSEVSGR